MPYVGNLRSGGKPHSTCAEIDGMSHCFEQAGRLSFLITAFQFYGIISSFSVKEPAVVFEGLSEGYFLMLRQLPAADIVVTFIEI